MLVRYVRLEREATGSYLTYRLKNPMYFEQACYMLSITMFGWEVVHGCPVNPDVTDTDDTDDIDDDEGNNPNLLMQE